MILVNGQPVDAIPVDDRGLAYGDGLFETMLARRSRLPLLDRHVERLLAGARALGFAEVPRALLEDELRMAAREQTDGIVKLIFTRGSGARGYRPPIDAVARRIIMTSPSPATVQTWQQAGVVLRYCSTTLEGSRLLAGLKHLNRLPQVMARAEWNDDSIHEGLMRDASGRIIAGTMSNLFAVHAGVLMTPPIVAGSVRGVMRGLVLQLAAARHIECREDFFTDAMIAGADEIFITNSILAVCPVRRIGDANCDIGTMTRLLQADVENELERLTCSDA